MADRYHIDLGDYSLGRFRNDLETRYVTPSRASLKENIPERFARMEAQGITNLGQLNDVLKTKKKLADFSVQSGLPEDYLVLLRREVNSYQPKPFNLIKIPQVDQETLAKLEPLGIKNTRQMFQQGRTRQDRADLADKSGIPGEKLLELVRLADLARIWGVGPVFTRILLEAGYGSVAAVAEADLEVMYNKVNQLNRDRKYTPVMASQSEVGMCIDYARILPKVVEF